MNGADVEQYYRDGRIREIADYCETDVVNTYRVWLRYELFRPRQSGYEVTAAKALGKSFSLRARRNGRPPMAV
jgi:hypothetical protein